jgi:hypothetical protein
LTIRRDAGRMSIDLQEVGAWIRTDSGRRRSIEEAADHRVGRPISLESGP